MLQVLKEWAFALFKYELYAVMMFRYLCICQNCEWWENLKSFRMCKHMKWWVFTLSLLWKMVVLCAWLQITSFNVMWFGDVIWRRAKARWYECIHMVWIGKLSNIDSGTNVELIKMKNHNRVVKMYSFWLKRPAKVYYIRLKHAVVVCWKAMFSLNFTWKVCTIRILQQLYDENNNVHSMKHQFAEKECF